MSKKAEIYRKQLETEDPLVIQHGIQAGMDWIMLRWSIWSRTELNTGTYLSSAN